MHVSEAWIGRYRKMVRWEQNLSKFKLQGCFINLDVISWPNFCIIPFLYVNKPPQHRISSWRPGCGGSFHSVNDPPAWHGYSILRPRRIYFGSNYVYIGGSNSFSVHENVPRGLALCVHAGFAEYHQSNKLGNLNFSCNHVCFHTTWWTPKIPPIY